MEIPVEQGQHFFDNMSKAFEQNMPKVLMNMANVGSGEFQFRLFNEGKAADGEVMHYRSAQYKKKRQKFGRQIGHKDLIFTGDMANSLNLRVRSADIVEYGFTNSGAAQIAGYQEEPAQTGKRIFALNTKEISIVEKAGIADFARLAQDVINAFPNMPTFGISGQRMQRRTVTRVRSTVSGRKRTQARIKNKQARKRTRR